MSAIEEIKERKLAYDEEEASAILKMKPRTLAKYRRAGRLKGNYALVGRNVLYKPEHIEKILDIFTVGRKAA
jgi:predicted site-specific integrase-resolvase